jgi:hypothetical protein
MCRPLAVAVLSSSQWSEERALVRWAHNVRCAVQVKGGRHEVPETAPQQAFEMLQVRPAGLFTVQLEE